MSLTDAAVVLAWVAIVLLAFAMSGIVRQVHVLGRMPGQTHGPRERVPGDMAPPLSASGPDPAGHVLLFIDGTCTSCADVLRRLAAQPPDRPVLILFRGLPTEPPSAFQGNVRILLEQELAFYRYGVSIVPYGVAVDDTGRIEAAQPVGKMGSLEQLLGAAMLPMASPSSRG